MSGLLFVIISQIDSCKISKETKQKSSLENYEKIRNETNDLLPRREGITPGPIAADSTSTLNRHRQAQPRPRYVTLCG